MHARRIFDSYIERRLAAQGVLLSGSGCVPTILRELAGSIIPSGPESTWVRRPSINDDGTPLILSWKTGDSNDKQIRVLAESGSLAMSVAEQITYALTKLNRLLRVLEWQGACAAINSITANVFPAEPSSTLNWRGGIWLGADLRTDSSDSELRVYLNLRYGSAQQRWKRLRQLVSDFTSESIDAWLQSWVQSAARFAIPVGLGVVISQGAVRGIRAYTSIENPSFESIQALVAGLEPQAQFDLLTAYDTFTSKFGNILRHGITLGYDFVPGATQPRRKKVDICCHTLPLEHADALREWIDCLLDELRYEPSKFHSFLRNIHEFWRGSSTQFVSLGFNSALEHLTIYVKPNT
jgi:hypothetical protein